jgi:hypothetical protein
MRMQVMDRVFKEIFDLEDNDPLIEAIKKQKTPSIKGVLAYSEATIDNLDILKANGTFKVIPLHLISLIRIFQAWNAYLIAQHGKRRIDWLDVSIINKDEFNDF